MVGGSQGNFIAIVRLDVLIADDGYTFCSFRTRCCSSVDRLRCRHSWLTHCGRPITWQMIADISMRSISKASCGSAPALITNLIVKLNNDETYLLNTFWALPLLYCIICTPCASSLTFIPCRLYRPTSSFSGSDNCRALNED